MPTKWRVKLTGQPTVKARQTLRQAWANSVRSLELWIRKVLFRAMLFGDSSLGVQGIAQTGFFRFVISSEGLSQLGITIQDASNLLKAYENSFRIFVRGTRLEFQFGHVSRLIAATPHSSPDVKSWLEFAIDAEGGGTRVVRGRGFVPRSRLGRDIGKSIRLPSPLGGLMLPAGMAGSKGSWRFPVQFQNYDQKWLARNAVPIRDAIARKLTELLNEEIRRG